MKTIIAIIIGLIGGFLLGIALSSFIGVTGMILFNEPIGIKYLPYYSAIFCSIIGLIWGMKSKV